ncbi:MAG: hypothetical protein U9P12_00135 [Verrucomicrobiota bacterium]|nr:hypothetical protein [Verrucomicrobiota bacterium]
MNKRNEGKHIMGVALLALGLVSAAFADTYLLEASQGSSQHWNTLSSWTNSVGGGNPTAILAMDDFDLDGKTLRTPISADPVFNGKSMVSHGGPILFKHTGMATITNFIDNGGALLINGAGGTQGVHMVDFTLNGWTRFQADPGRGLDIQIEGWTGSATLRTGDGTSQTGYYGFTVTDAAGFSGTFQSVFGSTDWKNDASLPSATYEIVTAGYEHVILNSDITVKALTIGGTGYAAGTYSFATLNAAHDSSFVDGGTGSITVLGNSESYKLTVDQPSGHHWGTLGDWANTIGGANPTAILPIDTFDMDGHTLRTPASADPAFGGKSLTSNGGPILFKHTGTATIQNFTEIDGTVLIVGNDAVTQGVHLVDFTPTVFTEFSAGSGRGIDLQIDGLSGAGDMRTGASTSDLGYYGLTIENGTNFTGKLMSVFGTTDWKNDTDISSATYEITTAGYEHIVLNRDIRVGALIIGSTTYASGLYSFAVLNAAHDSSFVDGGTGSIAVGLGPAPVIPPYTLWASQYPSMGSQTNQTDNPDGDGLNNLYEWGLGGDPTNSVDIGHVPTFGIVEDGGSKFLEYIHAKRNDSDDLGLDYHLDLNTDLVYGNWVSNNYEVGIGTLDSEFDAVTNRIPTDTEDAQFIKLMIESN